MQPQAQCTPCANPDTPGYDTTVYAVALEEVSSLWPRGWGDFPAAPTNQMQNSIRTASNCIMHIPQRTNLSSQSNSAPNLDRQHSAFLRHSLQHQGPMRRERTWPREQNQLL